MWRANGRGWNGCNPGKRSTLSPGFRASHPERDPDFSGYNTGSHGAGCCSP